jgi:hypothetical protein
VDPQSPDLEWQLFLKVLGRPQYRAVRSKAFAEAFRSPAVPEGTGGPMIGTIVAPAGKRVTVWLEPPDKNKHDKGHTAGAGEGMSPSLSRWLDSDGEPAQYTITAARPIGRKWIYARFDDIDIADGVQVSCADWQLLGKRDWALLITSELSGPVRVTPRPHVTEHNVRLFYATRALWGMEKNARLAQQGQAEQNGALTDARAESAKETQLVWLQRLETRPAEQRRWKRSVQQPEDLWHRMLERALGAPTVPLRSTEALVGDEARSVVRVDATVLDFLGVKSGDRIIVSWADRETFARVLLQDHDQRKQMLQQFRGDTGVPSGGRNLPATASGSADASAADGRPGKILPPWHLQAWVSPEIRRELGIPADTIVTLRRSVPYLVARNLVTLEIPVAGLIIAFFAIPAGGLQSRWWWIPIFVIATVIFAFIPLKLPRRSATPRAGAGCPG